MATISAANNEKVFSIAKWAGLNEHPDGDTRLKLGEASKMINWKITRDGNLKRRPGSEIVTGLCEEYTVHMSDNIERIMVFTSEDETVIVYSSVSADRKPGEIAVVGYSGSVSKGVWSGIDATVEEGVMTESEEHPFVVEGGVLRMQSDVDGDVVTVTELAERLAELDEGEYLYVETGEAIYAISKDSLLKDGQNWILAGYLVTSVPEDGDAPIMGMWAGYAGGKRRFLAACDGKVWSLWDSDSNEFRREYLGNVETDKGVFFIPFGGDVYILNGHEYYFYDGSAIATVDGYIPLVAIAIGPIDTDTDSDSQPDTPSQAGELLENVNLLIPKRRCWISPDGTYTSFQLPEKDLKSIDSVIDLSTGTAVTTGWTGDTTNGTVTFSTAPAKAVNAYEIGYTAKSHDDDSTITDYRAQVTGNLYAELYAGQTDTMLCIYGDGTNRFLYSGMDYDGMPRADYFPDQFEGRVGDSNTPITSMIRHGSTLIAFKTNETWSCTYGQITLANDQMTDAFYILPVSRDKGNEAMGQVRLVDNNPVTCSGTELYQWINSSYYTSNLTRDERQAKRISDRIQKSIRDIDFEKCIMWDDNENQEFYIACGGLALVWNYAVNAWYRYDGFNASRICNFLGDLYIGTQEGLIVRLTDKKNSDAGNVIHAIWESGALDFGAGNMRKYSSMLWVGLKPEDGTSVDVCVETDRKNTFREKIVSSTKAKVPGEPFAVRSKIKAKKFVYYRLLLSVDEIMPAVTVTNVDFRVRQTGYAK